MEESAQYRNAWQGLKRGFESGRLAHAYLICGAPRGDALRFADDFLGLLFGRERVQGHADICRIEPEGKGRQIKAESVRRLIHQMTRTSYEGGWKAGVIIAADRMNANSANALLKTLEEPPPKSVLLLLSDAPQYLLPTIVSRAQKIVLSGAAGDMMEEIWRGPLTELLHDFPPKNGIVAASLASRLNGIFGEVQKVLEKSELAAVKETEEELEKDVLDSRIRSRLLEVRHRIMLDVLHWARDVMALAYGAAADTLHFPHEESVLRTQAAAFSPVASLKLVQETETLIQRLEQLARRDLFVLETGFRRLAGLPDRKG